MLELLSASLAATVAVVAVAAAFRSRNAASSDDSVPDGSSDDFRDRPDGFAAALDPSSLPPRQRTVVGVALIAFGILVLFQVALPPF